MALDPQHTSYALNLMHTLELEQAFDEVVALALSCCRVFKHTLGGGLKLQVGTWQKG